MIQDDDFNVRIGQIRSRKGPRARPFIARVLAAAERAGGLKHRSTRRRRGAGFGRGRAGSFAAIHRLNARSRGAVIKARVVRNRAGCAPLRAHLGYLRRDGATRERVRGRMFDAEWDDADHRAFAEQCEGDRHHFRFIVSPDDADRLSDLKTFTRDLMGQAERDLGTKLDWIAVDHWNTEHPHVHVIVRGRADDGTDLVIARDYVKNGMRARAGHLVSQELGPRSELEIRSRLDAEVEADRWTSLDRALGAEAAQHNQVIDLRPGKGQVGAGQARSAMIARMRKLERLDLAKALGPGQWRLSQNAEPTMRALGERSDIIKRIHRGLVAQRIERSVAEFAIDEIHPAWPIVGRLVARGLDDELSGTAYAIIDGVDGRAHYVRLPDLDAASDAPLGGIVERRHYQDAVGRQRVAVAVWSDLRLEAQIQAQGATWLDRQLVGRSPETLSSSGFGGEVRAAIEGRIEHLIGQGLAQRQGQRAIFARNLLETLRRGELETTSARIASTLGLAYCPAQEGERVMGVYRQRFNLASGRFAMIDDGLGFTLVPWSPSLERQLGQQVSGLAQAGRVEWRFTRGQGVSL
jgi:type IV secretory pathway VirD2 relaxase